MLEVLLIRPGCTNFDEEGRIKGALDIPLSERGTQQARDLAGDLAKVKLECLYVAACDSAQQTAVEIRRHNPCRQKLLECLLNLDQGLWQGKLVSEVKRLQPKVYRQFQEHPEGVCPPDGETIEQAQTRIKPTIEKLKRRHRNERIGLLVPQPMAAIVRFALVGGRLGDLWQPGLDFGRFESLVVDADALADNQTLATV